MKRAKEREIIRRALLFQDSINNVASQENIGSTSNKCESQFLGRTDGEEFLSHEIGQETLCEKGKECASLVNYHKVSLMIIGNMIAPLRSLVKKFNWDEVIHFLQTIRDENKSVLCKRLVRA